MGRKVQGLVALGVAASVAGCGGSSAQAKVETTLRTFVGAIADGNVTAACDQMMAAQQAVLIAKTERHGARTCPEAMQLLTQGVSAHERALLRAATISDVTVTGAVATARLQYETDITRLELTGGRWLITSGISN